MNKHYRGPFPKPAASNPNELLRQKVKSRLRSVLENEPINYLLFALKNCNNKNCDDMPPKDRLINKLSIEVLNKLIKERIRGRTISKIEENCTGTADV